MPERLQLLAAGLALLVIVPVVAYQLEGAAVELAISLVSVALIVGSLYTLFSPAEAAHGH